MRKPLNRLARRTPPRMMGGMSFLPASVAWIVVPVVYLVSIVIGRAANRRWSLRLGVGFHTASVAYGLLFAHLLGGVLSAGAFSGTLPEAWAAAVSGIAYRALWAVCALSGASVALSLVRRFYWESWFERRHRESAPKFLRQIVSGAVYAAVSLIVMESVFDLHIPGLLAGSGILVAVVGFAMQDLLGNVISGASLNLGKPFRVGDWLLLDGRQAEVMEVNWRSTRLRTNDNHALDYPNNVLARMPVVNFGPRGSVHAMRVGVGVGYETPPNAAKAALLRATRHTAGVLTDPAPVVQVRDFGDNAVLYDVKFHIDDQARYPEIADGIRTHVWYELHREGMTIPSPVRNLRIERPRRAGEAERVASVARRVRAQPLFSHLSEAEAESLSALARTVLYGAGEAVVKAGEPGDSLFLLCAGRVRVELVRDGRRCRVASLGEGDCFGEMSLLTGAPRLADVTAETDCELVEISKEAFAVVLRERPELAPLLGEMLARRRAESDSAYAALAKAGSDGESRRSGGEIVAAIRGFFRL